MRKPFWSLKKSPSAKARNGPAEVGPVRSRLKRVWRAWMRVLSPSESPVVGIVRTSKVSVEPISSKSRIASTLR